MLGNVINDDIKSEEGKTVRGMELLNVDTVMESEKTRCHTKGQINELHGIFESLSGKEFYGYEIHMGRTTDGADNKKVVVENGNGVYGTYVHGIFDKKEVALNVVNALADKKGVSIKSEEVNDYSLFKEKQYDKLADILREYMDMDAIYRMLG